jgi:hypothetical protein
VKDVFDVVGDLEKTKTILDYSSQRAISVYPILDIIRRGQDELTAKKFARNAYLWNKWTWRKMVLSGQVKTTHGSFWRLFQAWKGLKRAVKSIFR